MICDFHSPYVSERLLQGDVGSGKTIIAFLLMLLMVENGYQAALMAPTEVLAKQHYRLFCEYFLKFDLPFSAVCLVGQMREKEKRQVREKIAGGQPLFIIGTHALIQDKVSYSKLSFVITDEQHRFGVKQRKTFAEKGMHPHALVMSATPIPRTLALILYGDMKLSTIRDVPAKRLPIKNAVMKETDRKKVYQFIAKQVQEGRQAYIICPLVDASDKTEAENVTEYYQKINTFFHGIFSIGMLHGKMKADEKNQIMQEFSEGNIQILVSTTVVEVGINVPNASVMLIENANRFGLAQLHQLRGRVGRGKWQSYCIFMDTKKEKTPSKRLSILSHSNDGFYIAEEDLKLRGPGDFYGIRQSGEMNFKLADIYQDAQILQQAAEDAAALLSKDPTLEKEEHLLLKEEILQEEKRAYTNL